MNRDAYNHFCAGLPATTHVVQWGGSNVWKVGGKVFAIGSDEGPGGLAISFKVSPILFEMLTDTPGYRPAPYLASRGFTWVQAFAAEVDADDLREYLAGSHRLVAQGLSRKARLALGLTGEDWD